MAITRLGSAGYGVAIGGSFAGRIQSRAVGILTQLGVGGYGTGRYGDFNRTPTPPGPNPSPISNYYGRGLLERWRREDDYETHRQIHALYERRAQSVVRTPVRGGRVELLGDIDDETMAMLLAVIELDL